MEPISDLERELEVLRETYRSGKTREESWRRSQLQALLTLLEDNEEDIFRALKQDIGKHPAESYRDEIGTLTKSVNYALGCLKQWMSSKKAKLPIIAFPATAELVPEPLGLVLIISSWNFPFGLSLEPLIGAIAAGNVVVLKPSEQAPASASVLAKTLCSYLDNNAVKVFQGGPALGDQLLQQKWDKIFFTGCTRVGKIVMTAAAKHLTPVIMELGGKCPAVVDTLSSSWDRKATLRRILAGKFGACAGQACIGIDYILSEKKFTSTLVEEMKVMIKEVFGKNPRESNSIARIINKSHFLRLKNLLDDPTVKSSIVFGGSLHEDHLFIEPTILVDPPLTAAIMTEEIFGPLLPIITLEKIEDSIEFIKSRPKPLTVYAFTNNEQLKRRLVSETSSGSVTFNDAIIQGNFSIAQDPRSTPPFGPLSLNPVTYIGIDPSILLHYRSKYAGDTIPFGGVGESGFGRYHGKFSFDAFTHEKAVVRRNFLTDFWFRLPPWSDHNLLLLKAAYRFDYLSLVLITLGLKKSY